MASSRPYNAHCQTTSSSAETVKHTTTVWNCRIDLRLRGRNTARPQQRHWGEPRLHRESVGIFAVCRQQPSPSFNPQAGASCSKLSTCDWKTMVLVRVSFHVGHTCWATGFSESRCLCLGCPSCHLVKLSDWELLRQPVCPRHQPLQLDLQRGSPNASLFTCKPVQGAAGNLVQFCKSTC